MSYDIGFKVKVEGTDQYIHAYPCDGNITWNLGDMIRAATGLEWKNEENNGLCSDIIPAIKNGLMELLNNPQKYKQYEARNGWGTIKGCTDFFVRVIRDWNDFCEESPELAKVATFWIE